KRGAAAVRSEEYLHGWRRNPKPSPWVKPQSKVISMGGETPVVRVLRTARSDKRGAAAIRSEEYLHRWRRDPKPSPWVKPQSKVISMGGETPVVRVLRTARSDERGAAAIRSEEYLHRWRRNPKPAPWARQEP